jgi:hypothetical protein
MISTMHHKTQSMCWAVFFVWVVYVGVSRGRSRLANAPVSAVVRMEEGMPSTRLSKLAHVVCYCEGSSYGGPHQNHRWRVSHSTVLQGLKVAGCPVPVVITQESGSVLWLVGAFHCNTVFALQGIT